MKAWSVQLIASAAALRNPRPLNARIRDRPFNLAEDYIDKIHLPVEMCVALESASITLR